MDEQELEPAPQDDRSYAISGRSRSPSRTYTTELEAEIVRVRNDIAAKRKQRGGAEALFKR